MIGQIVSLVTLILIFKQLQKKSDSVFEGLPLKEIGLVILSVGFSILYFIYGILSIYKGLSLLGIFKIEYSFCFIYATYRLYLSIKASAYQTKSCNRIKTERLSSETYTMDQLIKNTMICLENEEFEKAQQLIDKVDAINAKDQNILLLKKIVNQSFCY